MSAEFEQFVKERIYLKNVSPRTVDFYRDSWKSFERYGGELTKAGLAKYVVAMREAGVKPVSCNTFISGINAYLNWLHENGYLDERLKIQKLKVEQPVIKTLPETTLKAILALRPSLFGEWRLHALLCLAIDTGCRVNEIILLRRQDVDMDNLVIKVLGKGRKERIVPISVECRKVLFKFLRRHQFDLVFPTTHGGRVSYHNLNRDYRRLCEKLKIKKEGSFHRLRHTFATNYTRSGGNVFYLSKVLGHTTLQMTKKYIQADADALREVHAKTSLLARLRV